MSKESNADKPAFPARVKAMGYTNGLTKREWIATQLLAGSLANPDAGRNLKISAEMAILRADELLKQLNAEGTED